MDENSSPSTKFDTLSTSTFGIYFRILDIIKSVAYHKSYDQCDVRSKRYIKCNKNFNFTTKIWKF